MEKIQDQDRLATLIHQWNQDHYDIFELSKPNEVKTTMKVHLFKYLSIIYHRETLIIVSILLKLCVLGIWSLTTDR